MPEARQVCADCGSVSVPELVWDRERVEYYDRMAGITSRFITMGAWAYGPSPNPYGDEWQGEVEKDNGTYTWRVDYGKGSAELLAFGDAPTLAKAKKAAAVAMGRLHDVLGEEPSKEVLAAKSEEFESLTAQRRKEGLADLREWSAVPPASPDAQPIVVPITAPPPEETMDRAVRGLFG